MVQGVSAHQQVTAHETFGHGLSSTLLPWQTHVENAVEYTGPGGNNAPAHTSLWQKAKSHALDLALGVLLGGGLGALFHTKFSVTHADFFKGAGLQRVMATGAAIGAGLAALGTKDWIVNAVKAPYSIWYGLRHKHEINPGHKVNPFLPAAMMDMQNEDVYHYTGKNPMIPDRGFLSADIFDRTYVNGTYGGF